MKKNKKVLLLGGTGKLGLSIIKSKIFKNIVSPSKNNLNILNTKSIDKILKNKNFDLIINCAAMARMTECEKNASRAIEVNINGTANLVNKISNYRNKNLRFIHISTDAVYPSVKGNYSENSQLGPNNVYGWTKLASEYLVKTLKNYVIIRTRFFDKKNIRFSKSAVDIFTSSIEVSELIKEIKFLAYSKFVGTINVGSERKSDFANYKKFKKNLKPCSRTYVMKNLNFNIAKDASMNLGLLNKLKEINE